VDALYGNERGKSFERIACHHRQTRPALLEVLKKFTKRILSLPAPTTSTTGAIVLRQNQMNKKEEENDFSKGVSVWARPNMPVTFRAEVMPGRNREERTYRVKELLTSGRVTLQNFSGEHSEKEFEPIH
jgi:hypothetical protein